MRGGLDRQPGLCQGVCKKKYGQAERRVLTMIYVVMWIRTHSELNRRMLWRELQCKERDPERYDKERGQGPLYLIADRKGKARASSKALANA